MNLAWKLLGKALRIRHQKSFSGIGGDITRIESRIETGIRLVVAFFVS